MRKTININLYLEDLLADYARYLVYVTDKDKSRKSYVSYVRTLNKANNGCTMEWLKAAVAKEDPIKYLSKVFDEYFKDVTNVQPQSQWKTSLCRLGEFICGFTNSNIDILSIRNFERTACELVAQSAIFCTTEVFNRVVNGRSGSLLNKKQGGNKYGSWYNCKYRRMDSGQRKGDYIDGIRLDDNTYANKAIKYAVLEGLKKYGNIHGNDIHIFSEHKSRFEACHIWSNTCNDERYHTSVANLVLLPREIASLTDHCDIVKNLLKYEAWTRFGFKPEEEEIPECPPNYEDIKWRSTPDKDLRLWEIRHSR